MEPLVFFGFFFARIILFWNPFLYQNCFFFQAERKLGFIIYWISRWFTSNAVGTAPHSRPRQAIWKNWSVMYSFVLLICSSVAPVGTARCPSQIPAALQPKAPFPWYLMDFNHVPNRMQQQVSWMNHCTTVKQQGVRNSSGLDKTHWYNVDYTHRSGACPSPYFRMTDITGGMLSSMVW